MKTTKKLFFITFLLIFAMTGVASPAPANHDAELEKALVKLAKNSHARVGIAVKNLATGHETCINGEETYPMSSVFKIPILIELFRQHDAGELDLSRRIKLTPGQIRFGSGLLKDMRPGLEPTLYDLAILMITVSDNSATDILLDVVDRRRVQAMLDNYHLNIQVKKSMGELFSDLPNRVFEMAKKKGMNLFPSAIADIDRNMLEKVWVQAGMELSVTDPNVATPQAMNRLLELLVSGKLLSTSSTSQALVILRAQKLNSRLPYMLPDTVVTAHKTGYYPSVTNDVGIIYVTGRQPVVVSVFTKNNDKLPQYEMKLLIARVGKIVYDHYSKK